MTLIQLFMMLLAVSGSWTVVLSSAAYPGNVRGGAAIALWPVTTKYCKLVIGTDDEIEKI